MNRALLPILSRLLSLQVPSRHGADGARIVASRTDPTPITVLLREINETMMGRVLTFSSESGAALTIEASGRRILRVTDAQGLDAANECLSVEALEEEHKDKLIGLLEQFAVPRREIRVKSVPIAQGSNAISIGLPVALIADLLLVELNGLDAELISDPIPKPQPESPPPTDDPKTEESRISAFARANSSVLMAWLIVGGQDDGQSEGPEEMVDHLRAFLDETAADVQQQLDRMSNSPGEPVCLALGASLLDGHSVICARIDGGLFLGLAEGNSTQSLVPTWSRVAHTA